MEPTGNMAFGFLGTLAIVFGIIATVTLFCLLFFISRIRREVISMDRTLNRIAVILAQPDEDHSADGLRSSLGFYKFQQPAGVENLLPTGGRPPSERLTRHFTLLPPFEGSGLA